MPVFVFMALGICQAQAVPVAKIAGGETKSGTITGANADSYSFTVAAGSTFFVSAVETGNHAEDFIPRIDITGPVESDAVASAHPLMSSYFKTGAVAGTWNVKISRAEGGNSGGGYALKVIQIPGATGTALTQGGSSGSITRGGFDVYTFSGTAGRTATLSLNVTGGENFTPEALVFSPTGDLAGGTGCGASCTKDIALIATGNYTVVVRKTDGSDVTGAYTVSVSGY